MFAAALWNIWRTRNERVFDSPMEGEGTIIQRCIRLVRLTTQARLKDKQSVPTTSGIHRGKSHWTLPSNPWIKLDTDAAWRETDSYVDAELWGAYVGLNLAWEAGFRQVTDALAKGAPFDNLELIFFASPPCSIVRLLHEDMLLVGTGTD
ncbi:hypothetical protein F3Y22_tig00111564pilonHSYRG00017 [Hibiscus syriacus]|uniref:Uncharacterized protein n=1 Tax=Hibiscus syriacus TaxID=106335 RepID=A0A6A2YDS5_HIBSY|nr:hypothetical protein F3Y22_tig00111564pilonHSYRG00017 [Hibiscus syriacus]